MSKDKDEDESEWYGSLTSRNINWVQVGNREYQTWYGNALYFGNNWESLGFKDVLKLKKNKKAFPKDRFWLEKLFVCEYCFKYTDDEKCMIEHRLFCKYGTLEYYPGKIKYKSDDYIIRKVKGNRHALFCQCLCLFAKLFLETKTIFFSVESFDFYLVYGKKSTDQSLDSNQNIWVPMGYFSKEILNCWDENNLGCICVFPPYQNRKLGTLLISFSYEVSRFQGLISGPEHPLSQFGRISYLLYWSKELAKEFTEGAFRDMENVLLDIIARYTGFRQDDIAMALEHMKVLRKERNNLIIVKANILHWIETTNPRFQLVLDKLCLVLD